MSMRENMTLSRHIDDASAVGLVVNQLSNYIDSDIVDMARKKIEEIFG